MKRKGATKASDPSSPPTSPTTPRHTPSSPPQSRKHKEFREHYVFHENVRASLLSTEAPAQNYRGIVNLVMLVLVCFSPSRKSLSHPYTPLQFVTHIRLIMENILKYGILVNLTSSYVNWWATIPTLASMLLINFFSSPAPLHFFFIIFISFSFITKKKKK